MGGGSFGFEEHDGVDAEAQVLEEGMKHSQSLHCTERLHGYCYDSGYSK